MDPADPSRPPAEPGKSGSLFALALALLLLPGLASQWANPLPGLLWTELFVFLLPAVIATTGSNLAPRAWLRLRRAEPAALGLSALVGLSGWFLGTGIYGAVRALAPSSIVARFDLGRLFEGPPVERFAFTAAAVVVAPLCEEVAFRGHLAAALHSRHRPAAAIGASAVAFAILHLDPLRAPSLVLLGALYGWVAWRSASIWPAVVAHATNNGVAAALALSPGDDAARAEPGLATSLAVAAGGAAILTLVIGVYRALVPSCPAQDGLPLADPSDPSSRFRWARVPAPLRLAALVGAATLAALATPLLRAR